MVITVLGFVIFLSIFISAAFHFGDFSHFEDRTKSVAFRGIGGMILIVVGRVLMGIGRLGIAGSGIKLDPQQARKDVEPWSRMGGGVVKDALDEAGIKLGSKSADDNLTFDEKLRRLKKLYEEGTITRDEYEYMRNKIMDKM